MKTAFITVFQGTEFRNIIRTDIYRELVKQPGLRLVLLTDNQDRREYFESQFSASNVIYEVVEYRPHWSAPFFSFLKYNLIRTSSLDIKRKREFLRSGNYAKYFFKLVFNRLFARTSFRKGARWLALNLVRQNSFGEYFKKYQPTLVVSAHLFSDIESALTREARKRGIPVVGFIISWDKLTSRNMIMVLPDKLVVPNELVKRDAMRLADVDEKDIFIAGFPIFDSHFKGPRRSKEEFACVAGLNPTKRYLLFCPEGKTVIDSDGAMAALLDELIASGELPQDLQLIIRLPPNDTIDLKTHQINVVVQKTGRSFSRERGVNWDMDENDFGLLADTLYHASVTVQYASTIALEAAIFKKPILSVNIPLKDYPPIDWVYQYDHCRNLLKSEGIRKVNSREELVEWIKKYLENPGLDRNGREELLREQCYSLDGQAGKRSADFLLSMINL